MSGRWKVERHEGDTPESFVWCAYGVDLVLVIDETCQHFSNHAEALAFADRMARTREVVLPRGPFEIRGEDHQFEEPIKVEPVKHFPGHETVSITYTTHGTPAGFFLAPDEVRPLGLALLALAEQAEVGGD